MGIFILIVLTFPSLGFGDDDLRIWVESLDPIGNDLLPTTLPGNQMASSWGTAIDGSCLAGLPDLENQMTTENCPPRLERQTIIAQDQPAYFQLPPSMTQDLYLLRSMNPFDMPDRCPLSANNELFEQTGMLVKFHNREAKLQKDSMSIIGRLLNFIQGEQVSLDDLELEVQELYQKACPTDSNAFKPKLCANGDKVLLAAIREVRIRASRD